MAIKKCFLEGCNKERDPIGEGSDLYSHTPEGVRVFFCSEEHLDEWERSQRPVRKPFNRVEEDRLDNGG